VEILVSQINRNNFKIHENPTTALIPARWENGSTLRRNGAVEEDGEPD
jgi:hypothetical protein